MVESSERLFVISAERPELSLEEISGMCEKLEGIGATRESTWFLEVTKFFLQNAKQPQQSMISVQRGREGRVQLISKRAVVTADKSILGELFTKMQVGFAAHRVTFKIEGVQLKLGDLHVRIGGDSEKDRGSKVGSIVVEFEQVSPGGGEVEEGGGDLLNIFKLIGIEKNRFQEVVADPSPYDVSRESGDHLMALKYATFVLE